MKRILVLFFAAIFMATPLFAQKNPGQPVKLLRHVVLFKFKTGSTENDIRRMEEAFRKLPGAIKEIHSFEWGKNNSPENLNQEFTHCFFVSFKSEADRGV
jgi:hypothetical protein